MNFVPQKTRNKYGFIFAISFILNGYASGISGISLGTLMFIFYSIYATLIVIKSEHRFRFGRTACFGAPLLMLIGFVQISMLSLLFTSSPLVSWRSMIFTTVKLIIIAISISVVPYIFCDYKVVLKWLIKISTAATVYLIIQYIAYYILSLRLTNIFEIGFLRAYVEGHGVVSDIYGMSQYFRPASFFVEPSYYGTYIVCTLTMYLYEKRKSFGRKETLYSLFLSIGVLMSTSTASIYLLVLLWCIYFCQNWKNPKFVIVLLVIPLIIILALILNTQGDNIYEFFGSFGDTLRYTIEKPQLYGTSSRLGGSYTYISYLEGIQKFIGIGIGNGESYIAAITGEDYVYMNSITLILFWCGYLGILVYAIFVIALIKNNKDKCSQMLILIFIIKGFSSAIFFNFYSILILTVIIIRGKYKLHEEELNMSTLQKEALI